MTHSSSSIKEMPVNPPLFNLWMTDLGDILALAERSPVQSQYPLAVFRVRIFPSLWNGQYLLLRKQGKACAFVNWAWLSDSLSEHYQKTQCYIEPQLWCSGNNLWFMEIMGAEYLQDLVHQLRNVIPAGTLAKWHEVHMVGSLSASCRLVKFHGADFANATHDE